MNINEKINIRSYYKDTINRIKIIPRNMYEIQALKKYNFNVKPYFKNN